MMNYSEPGFDIMLRENCLTFSGKLEKSDYVDIDAFLRNVDHTVSSDTCVIDLTNLTYLNSSGIRSLATFILGSPKSFEIRINTTITWQTESIPALAHLKSKGITVIS
jgi:hypothetical protein